LTEVIIYSSPDDKKKNRGFCFLEYESHKAASLAKRRLGTGRIKVWGCDIIVDWADPQEEPDEATMSKVLNLLLLFVMKVKGLSMSGNNHSSSSRNFAVYLNGRSKYFEPLEISF
jgi:hypothetical protein